MLHCKGGRMSEWGTGVTSKEATLLLLSEFAGVRIKINGVCCSAPKSIMFVSFCQQNSDFRSPVLNATLAFPC